MKEKYQENKKKKDLEEQKKERTNVLMRIMWVKQINKINHPVY